MGIDRPQLCIRIKIYKLGWLNLRNPTSDVPHATCTEVEPTGDVDPETAGEQPTLRRQTQATT